MRLLCIDDGSEWLSSVIHDLRAASFDYRLTIVPGFTAASRALDNDSYDVVVVTRGFDTAALAALRQQCPNCALVELGHEDPSGLIELVRSAMWQGGSKPKRCSETEIRLIRQDRQRKMESIAAMDWLSAGERLNKFLELGLHELGHQSALVTEIVGPEATFLHTLSTTTTSIGDGFRCDSDQTFCELVLISEEPIGIPNVQESSLRNHPAREIFGVESYVACRVSGSPQNQKTLCYISDATKEGPTSEEDLEFIRSLAYRVDVELKNQVHEQELALTKSLFDAFMNNSPVIATLKDSEGVFRYVNRTADPVLGNWVKQFEGRPDSDLVDENDYQMIRDLDLRVLEHGETVQSRYPMHIPGHGIRYLHIIKFPVTSPGIGLCVGTVSLDITPQFEAKRQLAMAYEATLEGWTRTLDIRDSETQGHSRRVAELTVRLARCLGIAEDEIVHIWRGALLHDLGKIGIPDAILNKAGPLSEAEWEVMRRHPKIALDMLEAIPFLSPALDIPSCHHERWDGTGYPAGLKGAAIPRSARIFAVVDVFDALSSDRPYRKALTKEAALQHVREGAGHHFDPEVVEEFIRMIGE